MSVDLDVSYNTTQWAIFLTVRGFICQRTVFKRCVSPCTFAGILSSFAVYSYDQRPN